MDKDFLIEQLKNCEGAHKVLDAYIASEEYKQLMEESKRSNTIPHPRACYAFMVLKEIELYAYALKCAYENWEGRDE